MPVNEEQRSKEVFVITHFLARLRYYAAADGESISAIDVLLHMRGGIKGGEPRPL